MDIQIFITAGSLCLLAFILLLYLWQQNKERKRMEALSDMLDAAIDGTFLEKKYDETYLSAIEMRMAQYLKKNEGALLKLNQDQDKISALISDISHQTKTPISNISLYTELLLEKELSDEARACAKQIHGQAEKLQFLIGALIQTSRLENGIIKLSPASRPVDPMIEAAVAQAEKKAEERGVSIVFRQDHVDEKLTEGEAVFDEKWTQEALYNLFDNAVKYTVSGDCIEVASTPYELFWRIDVTDHGPGIKEPEQAKIFGRFYRGENALNAEGVGIGLYLTNQIVNGQGGYLKVASEPGVRTTFSMFLPRK